MLGPKQTTPAVYSSARHLTLTPSPELAYWNQGLDNYTDADFSQAGLDGFRNFLYDFRDHEIGHFTVLK